MVEVGAMQTEVYGRSDVQEVGSVSFPEWRGDRAYMVRFSDSLPVELERWSPVVDVMLSGMKFSHAFLTVDENMLFAGNSHRRPGIHLDGAWDPGMLMHGAPGPRHRPHVARGNQLLILASNVEGCAAFNGEFLLEEFNGGDCSSVPIGSLKRSRMLPGVAYVGDACSFIHEPLPMQADCRRSLVRLNVVVD